LSKTVAISAPSEKLERIDWKQDHVEEEHRIDVSQQSIDNEKDIAQKCETSKRHDRRHAEAGEDAECCGETQEIDPPHARALAFDDQFRGLFAAVDAIAG
jgi:hypothetical protein